jgi:NADPH:quinone reductase-like Zn-dependent oxidoreductase
VKAAVIDRYGAADVLEVREVEKPAPSSSQVLLRVHAAGVNPVDWKIRNGMFRPVFPPRFPYILGNDAAGVVEAVGPKVSRWNVGDAVYCGTRGGAYAEYLAVDEAHCAGKPAQLSFAEAAAIPIAGLTALQMLRDKAEVAPGDRVLVNGASGGVGTFAVQIAAAMGCEVTGVASTRSLDFVRELGAARVIDYTQEDFTKQDARYDAILDVVPNKSFAACRRRLASGGAYVTTVPGPGAIAWGLATRLGNLTGQARRCRYLIARPSGADLEELNGLIESDQLTPIVDRTYPLEQVRDAHRHSEEGHPRGKIVLTIAGNAS